MRFKLPPDTIQAALERIVAEGLEAALERHQAQLGRYVVVHAGVRVPAKVALAEAARVPVADFSGGYATTIGALQRAGFQVLDLVTGGVCPTRKVRDAARAVAATLRARACPPAPTGLRAYFLSGTNRVPEIRAAAALGHSIGVAAPELSQAAEQALAELAGTGIQVFVDSGAFSEVRFGPKGLEVVAPISPERWDRILSLYDRLAARLGAQLHLVAPDRVGDQAYTLELAGRYAARLQALAATGARILVPAQKGALPQPAFYGRYVDVAGLPHDACRPALPCNKAATTPAEAGLFRGLNPHLLGVGPRSFGWGEYVDAVGHEGSSFTADSCWIGSVTGRTNGPGGGPRVFTAAKDAAKRLVACSSTAATVALIAALTVAL